MGIGVIPYLATYCRYVSLFARARAVRGTIALTAATIGKRPWGRLAVSALLHGER